MRQLVAAINRLAAAIEMLIPALTQATREARQIDVSRQRSELDKKRTCFS